MLLTGPQAEDFAAWASNEVWALRLRPYQVRAGQNLLGLMAAVPGETVGLVMPRQSGKDELLAWIEAYILDLLQDEYAALIQATPTYKPQALIAMERLKRVADVAGLTLDTKENTYRVGRAKTVFLSTDKDANVRGNTANTLLIANEAQDIDAARWAAVFDPMSSSTNAPTLIVGTPWQDDKTLLTQMLPKLTATNRLIRVDWREVADENPSYGAKVEAKIKELGASHPFILSEYECVLARPVGLRRGAVSTRRMAWAGLRPRRKKEEA